MIFNVIGKKYNPTSFSDADQEISTLGSTDNAGNSVNFVSGIIRLLSGWDIDVGFYLYLLIAALCKYLQFLVVAVIDCISS